MLWQSHLRPHNSLLRRIEIGVFSLLLSGLLIWAWQHTPSALNLALYKKELRVALVSHPHDLTFMDMNNGSDQFELVLLRGFADHIGARLQLHQVTDPDEAQRLLHSRRADIAAGFLTAPTEDSGVEVGPEVLPIQKSLVYWQGNGGGVTSVADLPEGTRIGVTSRNPLPEELRSLVTAADHEPPVELIQYSDGPELVLAMSQGYVDYGILTSIELNRLRRINTELRTALALDGQASVVWLFPPGLDRSLIDSAHNYLATLRTGREFELLFDRHFGHLDVHDLVDVITFSRLVEERLAEFRPLFQEVALAHGLDWRFLAAVSYQESLWDPEAVSPTGVRGLMMLTNTTAQSLGVADRTDPRESIDGGARYVLQMMERLPEEITEPDRTWMALASYNVGLGHLLDARRLTEAGGDDPDLWLDVMAWLPLLAQREWHQQTRFGYARGWEPVNYVQNIRSYYDWLVQLYPHPDDDPDRSPLYLSLPLAL
jgi:membrane-bound lytic murein transglycosylase F